MTGPSGPYLKVFIISEFRAKHQVCQMKIDRVLNLLQSESE